MPERSHHSSLDRPYLEATYDRRSRGISLVFETAAVVAVGILHARAGWLAVALAAALGAIGAFLDCRGISRNWEQLSKLTMRDLVEKGRGQCLPQPGVVRSSLLLIALVAGGYVLFGISTRGFVAKIISLPLLYLAWLFGRDLFLLIRPPRAPRTLSKAE